MILGVREKLKAFIKGSDKLRVAILKAFTAWRTGWRKAKTDDRESSKEAAPVVSIRGL